MTTLERHDWRALAEAKGFLFHTPEGERYWDESAHYAFTLDQVEQDLEAPSAALHELCLAFVGRAVGDERVLARLRIPGHAWGAIRESWERRDPSLYGRLDLAYDGMGPAKLLEYNADTPTALYESAVFQWLWLEDMLRRGRLAPGTDQFNSVHDRLVARLALFAGGPLHLACMGDAPEDRGTVAYLEDCAVQAGLEAQLLAVDRIGLDAAGRFVDEAGRTIHRLFKLYPWEWAFADPFGRAVAASATRFVEPPWKAVLSNKGLLPCLWEMAPGHPNLLPAYFEDDPAKHRLGASFARKPLLSREGANVLLVRDGAVLARDDGPYGGEGYVRQALAPLFGSEAGTAVIGSWIVGDEPAGICVRESDGPITTNRSRFVPHTIDP